MVNKIIKIYLSEIFYIICRNLTYKTIVIRWKTHDISGLNIINISLKLTIFILSFNLLLCLTIFLFLSWLNLLFPLLFLFRLAFLFFLLNFSSQFNLSFFTRFFYFKMTKINFGLNCCFYLLLSWILSRCWFQRVHLLLVFLCESS